MVHYTLCLGSIVSKRVGKLTFFAGEKATKAQNPKVK